MSAFQQKRDQTMKPMYDATLDYVRMRDVGPAEQALLRAVVISPTLMRTVAYAMVAQLPILLSPAAYGRTAFISRMLWPVPEPAKN
jgi:hypothetical protein